jgi:hypothetical protein
VARRTRPHAFLWLLTGALALAIVAAALAPDRAPAFALYWNPIYRAEVALVVLALAYLLGTAGWMAWNGQAFRRIELPGGAALERDTEGLDAAATDFDRLPGDGDRADRRARSDVGGSDRSGGDAPTRCRSRGSRGTMSTWQA